MGAGVVDVGRVFAVRRPGGILLGTPSCPRRSRRALAMDKISPSVEYLTVTALYALPMLFCSVARDRIDFTRRASQVF